MNKHVFVWMIAFMVLASAAFALTGSGTAGSPYNISSCLDLNRTRDNIGSGIYYKLTNNIDCSDTKNWDNSEGFLPIGNDSNIPTSAFRGNFNGSYYNITGLFINKNQSFAGLFDYAYGGYISRVILIDANITGYGTTGALVGYSRVNSIDSCSSSGYVRSINSSAGGLIGETFTSFISQCYSTADVHANISAGGLVANRESDNTNPIINSYARGNVTSNSSDAGGLIGTQTDGGLTNAINSYSTGYISGGGGGLVGAFGTLGIHCINSFWDNQTSGITSDSCHSSDPAHQKSTSAMKNASTFTNSGWNFTSIWAISPSMNDGYPFLRWQGVVPTYSSFSGSTTNFANATDIHHVSDAVLEKSGSKIAWLNNIDANGVNFDNDVSIGSGFLSINLSKLDSSMNSSANIEIQVPSCNSLVIYHVSRYYTTLGDILANGVDCIADGSCSNIQCDQGQSYATVTFKANYFDGFGGSSGGIPEFSSITAIIALSIAISGFFVIRRKK